MIQDVLRDMNLFVDGAGYAGKVDELTPPKLTVKTEEVRTGGMDAPAELDMGLEKLECTVSTSGIDRGLLKLWGVAPGKPVPLTFRGAVQSEDGAVKPVVIQVRGTVKEIDFGSWKPGEAAPMKATIACRYYRLEHDGETVHEVDVHNMIRIVNGADQVAALRAALAL